MIEICADRWKGILARAIFVRFNIGRRTSCPAIAATN
jgi:hypothetical protein